MKSGKRKNKTAFRLAEKKGDLKSQIWRNSFWLLRKNQNWREVILAVEDKFHFWRIFIEAAKLAKFLLLRYTWAFALLMKVCIHPCTGSWVPVRRECFCHTWSIYLLENSCQPWSNEQHSWAVLLSLNKFWHISGAANSVNEF